MCAIGVSGSLQVCSVMVRESKRGKGLEVKAAGHDKEEGEAEEEPKK